MARSAKRDYSINERIMRTILNEDKKPTAVADKAGIGRDTFSRIIHCKRPLYADEIQPICKALGIHVADLFAQDTTQEERG